MKRMLLHPASVADPVTRAVEAAAAAVVRFPMGGLQPV